MARVNKILGFGVPTSWGLEWDGRYMLVDCVSRVLHPRQHSIGYLRDSFTGQKTQSKYWKSTIQHQLR